MTTNEGIVHTESEEKPAVHLTIKFRVEKFEALMNSTKPGEGRLESKGVSSELAPGAVWNLAVLPNGLRDNNRGSTGVFLQLNGPMMQQPTFVTFHLYLLGPGGKINSIYREAKFFGYGYGDALRHTYHERVLEALHADGSVVVAADVTFPAPNDDGSAKAICESALPGYEDHQRWVAKFSGLYGDIASSDCAIEIGRVFIPAHKSFLMAHSPLFHAMFTDKEGEAWRSGVIKITDSNEPEAMRAVVRYCYQGQLDAKTMDEEWTDEIFNLADRCYIAGLKALLEKRYIEKLNVENVVAMAVLADSYTAPKLKEACIKLIAREGETVFERAEWKELMKVNPTLTTQLAMAALRMK